MASATKDKYTEAVGRRKSATARVRLFNAERTTYSVNDRQLPDYFPTLELQNIAKEALSVAGGSYKVSVKITGGGVHSQAEAMRHGIARALVKVDGGQKKKLKENKLLTRDSRQKERKKFGLKKARKRAQWSKR